MIVYDEEKRVFKLDSKNVSYLLGVYDEGFLVNLYFGPSVPDTDVWYLVERGGSASFSANPPAFEIGDRPAISPDAMLMEYPCYGTGDCRVTALEITDADGCPPTDLRYKSHRIVKGKPPLKGLPSTYANPDDVCDTLEITLTDPKTGVEAVLSYSVFENHPVIVRSARIVNSSSAPVTLNRVYSACFDLPDMDKEFIHAYGRHNYERVIDSQPLHRGLQGIRSVRGSSSHNHNPFAVLRDADATEETGVCRGFSLVYSGNYSCEIECDYNATTRLLFGIEPDGFSWLLEPGEEFQTPEVVAVCSAEGVGGMSRAFHRFYSNNLIRGKWKTEKRPLLINSWEGTYFDFDEEKIYNYAKYAKSIGIELMVMDDGWFGHRNDDRSSLGDWYVNENKLRGGLAPLVKRINELGVKFGIWFEPEMISPDSDLYRAHPDWAIHTDGRDRSLGRHELVLDMTRKEVRDCIFDQMDAILSSCNISYVKWDFNRNLTEAASMTLPKERRREFMHRYVLGVYELMGRLTKAYPDLLLENCSGGGGRFDPGMLAFSPQIWCSDNTDPIARLEIQFGTSLIYPASTMGAHVSMNPRAGFVTKGNVALWGTFGFELNPAHVTEDDLKVFSSQVEEYHKYYGLIRDGDLYRLLSPSDSLKRACWEFVSQDKKEALVTYVTVYVDPLDSYVLKLRGLDADKIYTDEETGKKYSGALLMNAGLNILSRPLESGESFKIHLIEEQK
ncbi:MAG: alpha-galactosidase [Clostridia bacterium]|nr:alpha-galactosidase [Clostridia bacterium]